MPKRNDIKKILLIGSGPIVIGQACEFDYSGVQACKSLKTEGYELVLVNSNPATIMTDPDFADRTYIEPLTKEALTEIIRRERPDALLPTLGGQTALNLAMELADSGVLERYGVTMLGATPEVIRKAEDRGLFKEAMKKIGLDMPRSGIAHSYEEACNIKNSLDTWPLVIRPGFTLGGTGGGIARNEKEFKEICERGLYYSPTKELLIEESIEGWKEFELEIMRDTKDNCVIVCSIENIDPMGIHTGDSITVAPALTLTDQEYQKLRDAGIAVMREIGVSTGGSNVQFAINPNDGRLVIIEMNPRVSRSSALASKATGFPIAKIAAKLAVGYTLDEIPNDITQKTRACFEPSIDYIVTKIPRFAFEKFIGADDKLGTQMKSVGEAMAIGRTFKQSFQKALRSLETGRAGFGADGKEHLFKNLSDEELETKICIGSANRIYMVLEAITRKWGVEKIYELTKIDRWFLRQFEELAEYENEIRSAKNLEGLAKDYLLFEQAKEFGFSDKQIANILCEKEEAVRKKRKEINLRPQFHKVDTCAAEFKAFTPYLYSSYSSGAKNSKYEETTTTEKKKILILGGGPNRIGQGIEFDYCCVHASFALRKAGFETIMLNSNPETVSTDYDTSDKLYFEPLTLEDVLEVYERENCFGTIVQFGGQTPLNLAEGLKANGVNIIGTSPNDIAVAEDRELFANMIKKLGILQPPNGLAKTEEEAEKIAERIGYPILMRPSFVLGGRAMVIVYDKAGLHEYMAKAMEVSEGRAILIDSFLENATEVDVDCLSDGETQVIGGIMEHVELAGVHSGDSACTIPPITLSDPVQNTIREHTKAMAKELNVCGLMNVQYAIQNETVYVLEVNPRASRTVPFVSKAIGVPLAKIASLCMAGKKLKEIGFTKEFIPSHFSVKEAVFPFARFPGVDIILSPEMKSTGEVMGIDRVANMAYLKSQIASGSKLPKSGNIFLSLRSEDRAAAIPYIKKLVDLGFTLYCTRGTSTMLRNSGIPTNAVFKVADGRPNAVDLIEEGKLAWIVNTPSKGEKPASDEMKIRTNCLLHGIPVTTTLHGLQRTVDGLYAMKKLDIMDVCSLQEYSRHSPVVEV
ncbi:MAG: carbamoyl-phosphate synthase large subunit [Fibromonadaceae bacterium]|jgi:carbamoyl-phosphate synthase large subunit|nr:carbamoyl-phosphate synthase large subunit [Fibromonadaceae bacterium]